MIDAMYPGDSPLVLDLSIWVNRKYRTQVAKYLAEHRHPLVIRSAGSESRYSVIEFKKPTAQQLIWETCRHGGILDTRRT